MQNLRGQKISFSDLILEKGFYKKRCKINIHFIQLRNTPGHSSFQCVQSALIFFLQYNYSRKNTHQIALWVQNSYQFERSNPLASLAHLGYSYAEDCHLSYLYVLKLVVLCHAVFCTELVHFLSDTLCNSSHKQSRESV